MPYFVITVSYYVIIVLHSDIKMPSYMIRMPYSDITLPWKDNTEICYVITLSKSVIKGLYFVITVYYCI